MRHSESASSFNIFALLPLFFKRINISIAAFSRIKKELDRNMCINTSARSLKISKNVSNSSGELVSLRLDTIDSSSVAALTVTREFGKKQDS